MAAAEGADDGREVHLVIVEARFTIQGPALVEAGLDFVCDQPELGACSGLPICAELLQPGLPSGSFFIEPEQRRAGVASESPYDDDGWIQNRGGHTSIEISLEGC